ncbi:MAG: hypothetical protein OXF73_04615 [Gammaproteobacteria bacterium]|nr:hypothetical protein [Gammaproteobacteria bacterium]
MSNKRSLKIAKISLAQREIMEWKTLHCKGAANPLIKLATECIFTKIERL